MFKNDLVERIEKIENNIESLKFTELAELVYDYKILGGELRGDEIRIDRLLKDVIKEQDKKIQLVSARIDRMNSSLSEIIDYVYLKGGGS